MDDHYGTAAQTEIEDEVDHTGHHFSQCGDGPGRDEAREAEWWESCIMAETTGSYILVFHIDTEIDGKNEERAYDKFQGNSL